MPKAQFKVTTHRRGEKKETRSFVDQAEALACYVDSYVSGAYLADMWARKFCADGKARFVLVAPSKVMSPLAWEKARKMRKENMQKQQGAMTR